ncbi:phage prohead protease, HK97 family [Bradyrhizobium erythrophlei]|uniref:Phage prohead protease, HK97 family n=1 Tax=Bradyrhizobium erythrophlei TaxID=1437360 RepID=A0A1M5MPE2_9BRAD|nr:phage prohead protease, HK97 family [Bradyrhizobium erythrophlei]
MNWRGYEVASGWPDLEYGGVGYITQIGNKSVAPPSTVKAVDDGAPRMTVAQEWAERKHIQGYAIRWRSIINQGDKYFCFLPGSIKYPMLGEQKLLLFDHDPSEIVATTCDGLVLHADDYGLAMRLYIDNRPVRRKALETVRSGERTALSVGVIMHGSEYKEIDGLRIRMVRSATLEEISLVPEGACRPAYCTLIDGEGARLLEDDANSLRVLKDGAARAFTNALREAQVALSHR